MNSLYSQGMIKKSIKFTEIMRSHPNEQTIKRYFDSKHKELNDVIIQ